MMTIDPTQRPATTTPQSMTPSQRLMLHRAGGVFAAGFVLHDLDHARRGFAAITDQVIWAGTVVAMIATATLTLVAVAHRSAPVMAAASGTAIAIGVSATHLLPAWGALSDSLPDGRVDAVTWIAVLAEVMGALLLGLTGFVVVRQQIAGVSADSGDRSRSTGRR